MSVDYKDRHYYSLLLSTALDIATEAHKGQKRRGTDKDYITHPLAVAELCHTPFWKAVAYLHDVLEDTSVTEQMLRNKLPTELVDTLVILTRKEVKVAYGTNEGQIVDECYYNYIDRIIEAGEEYIQFKIKDIICNLLDTPTTNQKTKYKHSLRDLYEALEKGK